MYDPYAPPPPGHYARLSGNVLTEPGMVKCQCGWSTYVGWWLRKSRANKACLSHYWSIMQERRAIILGIDENTVLAKMAEQIYQQRQLELEASDRDLKQEVEKELSIIQPRRRTPSSASILDLYPDSKLTAKGRFMKSLRDNKIPKEG